MDKKIFKLRILDEIIFYSVYNSMFSNDRNDKLLNAELDFSDYIDNFRIKSLNLCINISNICNLQCTYCFNNEKGMKNIDLEKIKIVISDFIDKYPDCEKVFVDLSGKGEPLLNLPIVYDINNFCKDLSNKIFKEILVSFVTNGVLLTPKIASTLQKRGILFGISLDGDRDTHNLYRKDKGGNETFDIILNNIKNIPNRKYIGCAVTLTNKVFSLVDSLENLSKYFNTISYKPVRNNDVGFNKKSLRAWKKEYQDLTLFLCEKTMQNDLKYIKILLNGEDYLGKYIYRCLLNFRTLNRCDAGISRFSIDYNGEIYDCPAQSLSYCEKTKNNSIETLKEQINRLETQCYKCRFKLICGGECNVIWSKRRMNDKIMCSFKQYLIKCAIYFVYKVKYYYDENIYIELINFCKEKNNRNYEDNELKQFLMSNPHYSFCEGKKIFDKIKNRY